MCLPQVVLEVLDREQGGFPCEEQRQHRRGMALFIVEVETKHVDNGTGPMFVA